MKLNIQIQNPCPETMLNFDKLVGVVLLLVDGDLINSNAAADIRLCCRITGKVGLKMYITHPQYLKFMKSDD